MNDASGKRIQRRTDNQSRGSREDTYRVTVTADWSYLKDKDRQYPVVIDPTIKWTGNTDLGDVYILSGSTYKDYNFLHQRRNGDECGKKHPRVFTGPTLLSKI